LPRGEFNRPRHHGKKGRGNEGLFRRGAPPWILSVHEVWPHAAAHVQPLRGPPCTRGNPRTSPGSSIVIVSNVACLLKVLLGMRSFGVLGMWWDLVGLLQRLQQLRVIFVSALVSILFSMFFSFGFGCVTDPDLEGHLLTPILS
jgi:hypothetical protein